jgi:hypothetical protein
MHWHRLKLPETEKRFYDQPQAGAGELFDWYQRHRTRAPRALAAGLFMQVVSAPHLFIEGNARTATLLVSSALARGGVPPLVATRENAGAFVTLADRIVAIDRNGFSGLFGLTAQTHRFSAFLATTADPRFAVLPAAATVSVGDR